jgi:hypothetical protein
MHHNKKGSVRESEKSELTDRGGVSCSSMKKPLYTLEHPPQKILYILSVGVGLLRAGGWGAYQVFCKGRQGIQLVFWPINMVQ